MKTVALVDGALDPSELAMLRAGQELSGAECALDSLETIEPAELAAVITDPAVRQQLVRALVIMSLVDQEADRGEVACIEAFARALAVETNTIPTIRKLSKGYNRLVRLDIIRRFWAVDKIREKVREGGLGELWKTVLAALRRYEDPALAERYRALGSLPSGTLGRAYHDAMREDGFPLPGEQGAAPETITYHDMAHVLGGYGTTPDEEVLVASFSAGFRQRNPMTFVLFVICQFHLGLQTAPGVPPERGYFDPRTALSAIRRGADMNIDLSDGWEYWDVIDRPLEELRARYNIQPRE